MTPNSAHAEAVVCALARVCMGSLQRQLRAAADKRDRASIARRMLPAGASSARRRSASKRYDVACEAYDRLARIEADVFEILRREGKS